jgi:hypothetical protein
MAIAPRRLPRILRDGHRHRGTARARAAIAIGQLDRNGISQLER